MLRFRQVSQKSGWIGWLTICLVGFACFIPSAASGFGGFLTTTAGGLQASGNWASGGLTQLVWQITQDAATERWDYTYWFSHPMGETGDFILECAPGFAEASIFNGAGFTSHSVGYFDPGDYADMPGSMHGIKFEGVGGTASKISFSCFAAPVWGDFFASNGPSVPYDFAVAKSTMSGSRGDASWNAGFSIFDLDPRVPAGDCTIGSHLLVPSSVVPEPATLLLFGGGLVALAGIHRRRRR